MRGEKGQLGTLVVEPQIRTELMTAVAFRSMLWTFVRKHMPKSYFLPDERCINHPGRKVACVAHTSGFIF